MLRRDLLLGVDYGGLLFRKLLGAFKVGETVKGLVFVFYPYGDEVV